MLRSETLYYQWHAADHAWQDELERVYGREASNARYDTTRHKATPELLRLKTELDSLCDAYYAALRAERV